MKSDLRHHLLSALASALKICTPTYPDRLSYIDLNRINNRATPTEFSNNKHALLLHELTHTEIPQSDWIDLDLLQTFNSRSSTLNFFKCNRFKIGENLLCNRFHILNGKINIEKMNLSNDSFKVKCKTIFLQ